MSGHVEMLQMSRSILVLETRTLQQQGCTPTLANLVGTFEPRTQVVGAGTELVS